MDRIDAHAERDAGVLRRDITINEIEVIIYAITQVGVAARISPTERERFTSLILDGLRRGTINEITIRSSDQV